MRTSLRTLVAGAGLLVAATFIAPTANAQIGFVVQGSYGLDVGEDGAVGVGAGLNFGLGSLTANSGISAEATFDYFFAKDPLTYWEINGNALYDIKSVNGLYVGAGVNYAKSGYDGGGTDVCDVEGVDCTSSDVGLNVLSGYKFGGGKGPFVQARFSIGGGEQLVLTGGFRF